VTRITPLRAVLMGCLLVNGPVYILLLVPSLIVWWLGGAPQILTGAVAIHMSISFGLSFFVAWLWWSLTIPRWRVWAYERVSDIPRLKELAVQVRLTWPDGSIFEKTEIKSQPLIDREIQLLNTRRADVSHVSPNPRLERP
jgi:hypothetical protein